MNWKIKYKDEYRNLMLEVRMEVLANFEYENRLRKKYMLCEDNDLIQKLKNEVDLLTKELEVKR